MPIGVKRTFRIPGEELQLGLTYSAIVSILGLWDFPVLFPDRDISFTPKKID
ncbi:uncharacterized protein G2W53_045043 [Senna tora]|uniref:Uncharacterized protein n=1 Tax=Senna tora TaxID=362788 RepID=A0A834SCL8_9FABA|nr:uncharacterized protein G2W53_045043 [Senna tora]